MKRGAQMGMTVCRTWAFSDGDVPNALQVSPGVFNERIFKDRNEQLVEGKVDWKGKPVYRNKHRGAKSSFLVLAACDFQNMATLALAVNLVTYFNTVMHYNISDAANYLTNFMGTSYILSIIVAYLTDGYLGRFKSVLLSLSLEFLGIGILTMQAYYPKLQPPKCNIFVPTSKCFERVSGENAALLFVALYLLALGAAGVKASPPKHGAD